jgi:S-DNA-T family DNA segregation ATPase FtsK/SpoIIIE
VSIRVVETIPGKNLMGLELPNARRQMVRLSEILGRQAYADSALADDPRRWARTSPASRSSPIWREMPHLLVAGTTGSGKSVGINAMMLSLLYKADPSQVRLILIDPEDARDERSTRASRTCSRRSSPTCGRPATRSTGAWPRWSDATGS